MQNYLGTFSGTCSASFPAVVDKFLPDSTCQSGLSSDPSKYIKQMVSIPKNLLCGGILNTAVVTGDNPFSGGKGVKYRPYKICNEWQLNQIGERNTLLGSAYDSSFYKLMNHLDMNKASNVAGFAAYPAPVCAGDTAAKIDQFHNLNPLDGHLCGAGVVTSEVGFTGDFDGAGYSISNGRISTENLSQVGFVRLLGTREVSGSSGTIRRLQFKNLSIRGDGYIGGIAGDSNGAGLISDVKIDKLDVEGKNYVGGAIGYHQGSGFKILKTRINNAKIRGVDNIGGLVGYSSLLISESSFRGVITSDDSSSPYFAGGLVGINNASGSISSSFSEGFISTHTSYIGGIAGKNFGTLTNVYSTMGISSLRNSPGTVSAAGIAPYNSGTITNCFSDTRKMYVGGATFGHDGIVLTDAGTVTNCLTDVLNSSTFVSGSYSQVRTNSWLSSNFMSPGGSWQYGAVDGMTPRLSWETRECLLANNLLSVSSQVSTLARGSTQDNPVVICNLSQLQSISARGASEFYRLGEDINLSSMGIVSNSVFAVDTLNGKLNGNGKALYGLDVGIDNVMDNSVGIFKTVSSGAKISNLNLYANRVYISADTVNGIGLLTNINSGELQNINSFGSSMIGTQSLGGVAAQNTNSGVIKNVRLEGVHIVGDSYIGSVAAQNTGRIEAVSTLVNIGSSNSAFAVGGIAGQNNPDGVIEQVTAEGSFNLTNGAPRNIGGIIGVNYGKLFNSYVSDNTSMNLAITASSEALGGVVGSNESGAQLGNLFFLGKMIGTQSSSDLTSMLDTDSTTDERELGPIIGKNNGGIFSNILSVNDYLLWGNSSANVSSCDDTTNTIILTATPGIASGALLHHSFSFLIPYTSSSLSLSVSGFSLTGQCPANGDYLTLYESYHNYGEYGSVVSISGMGSLATYSGFSVGLGDSAGVIGYHMAKTYNTSIPASSPIWVMDSGEDYPRLLRVERD